ncbi:hypothetical protein Moror_15016, partial [Moniliophthora roreri MCA 2997]
HPSYCSRHRPARSLLRLIRPLFFLWCPVDSLPLATFPSPHLKARGNPGKICSVVQAGYSQYYAPLPADSSSSSKSHHAETGSIDSLGRSVERLGPTISPSTVLNNFPSGMVQIYMPSTVFFLLRIAPTTGLVPSTLTHISLCQ